jgi:hypothetical protein
MIMPNRIFKKLKNFEGGGALGKSRGGGELTGFSSGISEGTPASFCKLPIGLKMSFSSIFSI